jgi:hypothetical protein
MNCHQGHESTVSVNKLTAGLEEDTVSDKLRFLDIHYFAAGTTHFGTEAKGGYEYDGKKYVGLFKHTEGIIGCTDCHTTHGLDVAIEKCVTCHQEAARDEEGLRAIRMSSMDYDGDGNTEEGIADEIVTLREALYTAIQNYAKNVVKTPIVYDASNYPFFFTDTNGNGQADTDETEQENQYNTWTPTLLWAAYNYQYTTEDPGAFAHNGKYILQLLYDSLENLSALKAGMTRP